MPHPQVRVRSFAVPAALRTNKGPWLGRVQALPFLLLCACVLVSEGCFYRHCLFSMPEGMFFLFFFLAAEHVVHKAVHMTRSG